MKWINIYNCLTNAFSWLVISDFKLKAITTQCCLSIPPENIRKPLCFLMFSGGIDKQHWAVMGFNL